MTHLLVLGCGSAGKRHMQNFVSLGCGVSGMDPRADRRGESEALDGVEDVFASIDEALAGSGGFDGAVVASPTSFHVRQSIGLLRTGVPVLLEKPVSVTLEEAEDLEREVAATGMPLLLGYTWRWWPPLARVRAMLAEGVIGPVRHVHFHMSAHLADWHPWEPYQEFFMSSRVLGGGALLDESHWIDLMIWLFGMPTHVTGTVSKRSGLDIETDDFVNIIATYPDGMSATIHLDLLGRPHEKSIRFIGEGGTMFWTAEPNAVAIGRNAVQEWQTETFDCERNDMFLAVAREFLDVIARRTTPSCTVADGVSVMRVIEAVRRSSETGQRQKFAGGEAA